MTKNTNEISDTKVFFVVGLNKRPDIFLKDEEWVGHEFGKGYLGEDNGFWNLVEAAINDYENEHGVLRFKSLAEAEKALYDLMSRLDKNGKGAYNKDVFEITCIEVVMTHKVVKTFDGAEAVLALADDYARNMRKFEDFFVGTPLGYKLNATKADMENARKKDFEGYEIESYDKHYQSWLELNDEA